MKPREFRNHKATNDLRFASNGAKNSEARKPRTVVFRSWGPESSDGTRPIGRHASIPFQLVPIFLFHLTMATRDARSAAWCSSWNASPPAEPGPLLTKRVFVITSLASPGVVIQLDGRGEKRLVMTLSGSFLFLRKLPR